VGYREDFEEEFQRLKDAPFEDIVRALCADPDAFDSVRLDDLQKDVRRAVLIDDVNGEFIPGEREALKQLCAAIEAVHPETFDRIFGICNSDEPLPPELIVDKTNTLGWIDEAIASSPDGSRPPNTRESLIIERLAEIFQAEMGYTAEDVQSSYRLHLLLFVRLLCDQYGIAVPRTHDSLRTRIDSLRPGLLEPN
jgi:hypothetical protein